MLLVVLFMMISLVTNMSLSFVTEGHLAAAGAYEMVAKPIITIACATTQSARKLMLCKRCRQLNLQSHPHHARRFRRCR